MGHVTFSDLRQNMASYLDRVADDREPLVVTRSGGKGNVVIMSEDEFAGWQETVHLLSSPRNARRLLDSVRQARAGKAKQRYPRFNPRTASTIRPTTSCSTGRGDAKLSRVNAA